MTDDELNRAIDAVARDMVSADSPASLRAAVTARIEKDRRWRGVSFSGWAWAAAGTTVVVVAVGTWLAQPAHQPQPKGSLATASTPAGPPPVDSIETPPITTAAPAAASAQRTVATRARTRPPRPTHGLAWEAGPEPLAGPAPIIIDALSPDSLEIPEIQIDPIADIEPITIPAAGPGLPEPQRRDSR